MDGNATSEAFDAVVIGGGIAGLTAAWRLRHRRVLLLEAESRVGGRMFSLTRGEYWLNFGAHLFPGPDSVVEGLVREVGLQTVPVTGGMMCLALGDRILSTGSIETYPFRLPLTLGERVAFARAGLRLQREVGRFHRDVAAKEGEAASDVRVRLAEYGAKGTFADFLGALPPKVASIFVCAAHRATAEPEELSAGCGVALFAKVWSGSQSLDRRNLLGGSGRLPQELGARLGDRVQVGTEAVGLSVDGSVAEVTFRVGGETRTARARHVILAIPGRHAKPLLATVSPSAADLLGELAYGAFLSMAILTNETGPMPWDRVYAMATPGRAFDMFFNHAQPLRKGGQRSPGGSLMVYTGAHAAESLMARSDDEIRDVFLRDLYSLYPGVRDVIVETRVQRWPIGNVYARPGHHPMQPELEGAIGPAQNVHLAGDHFAKGGGGEMEAAAESATVAADRVDRMLMAASA
jgi:protoporphyrinogen/coproporphyrinogen III oxidase